MSSVARADEQLGKQLTWRAPEGCPTRSDVLARIRAQLRDDNRAEVNWQAVAAIAREPAAYRLELDLRTADGLEAQRVLTGASCEALADATALLIALALEPQSEATVAPAPAADGGAPSVAPKVATEPRERTPPPAQAPAAREPAAAAPNASERVETEERFEADSGGDSLLASLAFALGAALRLDRGTLPGSLGYGFAAELGLRLDRLEAAASLTFLLSASSPPDAYPTARVRGQAFLGGLALGCALVTEPVRVSPELRFEHGVLDVEVTRIASPASGAIAWTAIGGGVRATAALPAGFELVLDASLLFPFLRPRTLVRTRPEDVAVYTMAAVLLRFSAGVRYVFE